MENNVKYKSAKHRILNAIFRKRYMGNLIFVYLYDLFFLCVMRVSLNPKKPQYELRPKFEAKFIKMTTHENKHAQLSK